MPYGVRIIMIGRFPANPRGVKTLVCSFTPSRIGTITSRLSNTGMGGVPSVCWAAQGSAVAARVRAARNGERRGEKRRMVEPDPGTAWRDGVATAGTPSWSTVRLHAIACRPGMRCPPPISTDGGSMRRASDSRRGDQGRGTTRREYRGVELARRTRRLGR